MEILALVAGYTTVIFLAVLGAIMLWKFALDKINLTWVLAEDDGNASLSRFQFFVFTFVVATAITVLTLESGTFPQLGADILGLLGISAATYGVSKGIQKAHESTDAELLKKAEEEKLKKAEEQRKLDEEEGRKAREAREKAAAPPPPPPPPPGGGA